MKTLPVKTLIAAAALAATTAVTVLPTPASAIGVFIGPRGGVGIGLGRPGFGYRGYGYRGYGYGRGFYGRGYYGRGFYRGGYYRRGFRRF